MSGYDFYITKIEDLIWAVDEFGFIPMFRNSLPGFSLEEHADTSVWFPDDTDGAWEWKGPVIRATGCAYGKFFEGKAAFISRKWFTDFANYRRDGYDFDARFDDELVPIRDKELYDLLNKYAPIKRRDLRKLGDYRKTGKKGFDTIITRLQRECYVIISDFVYDLDKKGNVYGWGVSEYSTPEKYMGEVFTKNVYAKSPEDSFGLIFSYFKERLPWVNEDAIQRILR